MKFILNTSIRPHFCALFDDRGIFLDRLKWDDNRQDGAQIFSFLEKNKIESLDISFLGGVSGPGGFSSLRVGAGILNALSFAKKIPIHAVRTDVLMREFIGSDAFVLESFGDKVFVPSNGQLVLSQIETVIEKFRDTPLFVKTLPEQHQKKFIKTDDRSLEGIESILLSVLEKQNPTKIFVPEYLFPAI